MLFYMTSTLISSIGRQIIMCGEVYAVFGMVILAGLWSFVDAANSTHIMISNLKVTPVSKVPPMEFNIGEGSNVFFHYKFESKNITHKGWILSASTANENVAYIKGQHIFYIDNNEPRGNITIQVEGSNAGRSKIRFTYTDWLVHENGTELTIGETFGGSSGKEFHIFVTMKERLVDKIFNVVILLLVLTANIGMGTQVDLNIVRAEFKRPVSVFVGFFSQFIFMPLIAYGISYALQLEPGISLGLFALGCAPGGLLSNILSYLLDGNVSLSITLTLMNTLASLGIFPFWMFTLGSVLYNAAKIKIPFVNILVSLFLIIIPTVIGLYMQVYCPRAAKILIQSVKYIMSVILIFIFTVGVYANWWVLDQVNTDIMIASTALPYLGFILGALAGMVARLSYSEVITISIETGIQNTAIPIVLLNLSLSEPEKGMSMIIPIIAATVTPIPMVALLICKAAKPFCTNHRMTSPHIEDEATAPCTQNGKDLAGDSPVDPAVYNENSEDQV